MWVSIAECLVGTFKQTGRPLQIGICGCSGCLHIRQWTLEPIEPSQATAADDNTNKANYLSDSQQI